jgi:hypothetical protein
MSAAMMCMAGNIDSIADGWVRGWARHPVHGLYALTVHALVDELVVATTLADGARPDGLAGFAIALPPAIASARVTVLLGETDERLALSAPPAPAARRLRVEDLIATRVRRPWINGACVLDAVAAGLRPETVIDLLCRDALGRAAGPVVIANGLQRLGERGYDGVRRMLIESSEYRYRRVYADHAPGAIFSQSMILAVAGRDFTTQAQRDAKVTLVSAEPLLALEDEAFVTACYRQILRKDADRAGLAHYRGELAAGMSKVALIRHLADDFEAVSAGICVVDLPVNELPAID